MDGASSVDRVGHVEQVGFDHIPDSQRHGTPKELFAVWAAANIAPLYLLLGGILMVLGLNLWQALLAVVLGNLTYAFTAWQGIAGPAAGTPTVTISRAQYGPRGNQLSAFLAWFNLVAFEAVNFVVGASALNTLLAEIGVRTTTPVKAATLAFVIVVSFGLAYYGHATIVRFQELATWALGIGAGLLLLFALGRVDWSYTPQQGLHGFAGLATWFVALGVIVSGAISWCTVPADYTRYLPRSTRSGSIVLWTTVGCFLPATLLCTIAVLAGTRVDMSDPLSAIKEIVPAWFYIPVVAVLLLGSMTNNVLTIYSSSMSLQTLGLKIKRYQAVLIDGVIGTAMAFYATFVTDFLTALTEFLQLALVWYAPYTAIFIVDIVLRRNRYDGVQLHAREGGIYWSRNGFHVPGVVALLAGMASGLLFSTTARFQGPLSTALSNIDLSYIVSAVVGGAVYAVLQRRALATSRLKTTSLIPGQAAVPLVTDAVVADPVADPNGA